MRRSSMPAGAGWFSGSRMCAVKAYCSACVRPGAGKVSGGADMQGLGGAMTMLDGADVIELANQLRQRRNIEVALEQGRNYAELRISQIQQIPNRIDDRGAVTVDDQVGSFV